MSESPKKLVLPRWRVNYNRNDKLVYFFMRGALVQTLSVDDALAFARDTADACGQDMQLQGEPCPCGSGKKYGACCLGSGI